MEEVIAKDVPSIVVVDVGIEVSVIIEEVVDVEVLVEVMVVVVEVSVLVIVVVVVASQASSRLFAPLRPKIGRYPSGQAIQSSIDFEPSFGL